MDRKNSFMDRNDLNRDSLDSNELDRNEWDRDDLDRNPEPTKPEDRIEGKKEQGSNYHFGTTDQFESDFNPEREGKNTLEDISDTFVGDEYSQNPYNLEEYAQDFNDADEGPRNPDDSNGSDQVHEDSLPQKKKAEPKKKKREPIPFGLILRYFFTALAAANLILLFVFNYNVPGFSYVIHKLENYRDHVEGVDGTTAEADNTVIFEYDNDTYTYAGKGEFDPTIDVTVKSMAGNELSKDFLSSSVTGEASKQIVYSYKSEDGQYYGTTNRDLKLENYNAPVVVLHGTAPVLTDGNLAKVADLCKGIYTASDGYGKDITDSVTVTAVPDTQYNGEFIVKFSVTNIFGDTAQNELRTTTEFKEPHMKLTKTEVSIPRGESFDPYAYVLYAVDADGSNLMDLVDYTGDVDTFVAGDYEVKYNLESPSGKAVKTKTLTVHITE